MQGADIAPVPESRPVEQRGTVVNWPLLGTVALVVTCAAIDVWWLRRFRAGFPLDINESDYMGFALGLKDSLARGGLAGAWHTWSAESGFGPLLPLGSLPVFALFGDGVVSGFGAQLLFFVLLVVSSYALGTRLTSSRSGGLLLAMMVAATPTVIDFTRTYEFPVTAAAVVTACTYALLRSEALTRWRWAIIWGVLLGLMPLARTMTIAFIPAQLLAAGWLLTSRPGPRKRRVVNASSGLAAAVVTAGIWFVTSWHAQLSYLSNFGYGSQSARFSSSGSKLSVGYWTRELVKTVREDLYLPLAVLIIVLVILGLAALVVRYRRRPSGAFRTWAREWSSSDAAVVILVVVEGYLAITSSRNEGVGFRVPLLPALLAVVLYVLWRLPWRSVRLWTILALISISTFNIAMKADAVGPLSGRLDATVPGLGKVPIVDGTGWIQSYVLGALEAPYATATKPLPDSVRAWMPTYKTIVAHILSLARDRSMTANVDMATDEPLLNAYDLSFAAQLHFHSDLFANVLPGAPGTPTLAAYQHALRQAELTGVNGLITVSQVRVTYFAPSQSPSAGQALFEQAAASLGFSCAWTVALPDARRAFISWRASPRTSRSTATANRGCAPYVQRTVPATGALGVPPTARIVVVFDEPMDRASTARAVAVVRADDLRPIAGTVRFFGDQAVVFIPTRPLPRLTTFTATVTAMARAAIGELLPHAYTWAFTTG